MVKGVEVRGEELAEVLVEFLSDDEFIQFLPDRGFVKLVSLHDAIDGPEDVTFKKVLDEHCSLDLRNQLEGPVVVVALDLAEQPERLPVISAWVMMRAWGENCERIFRRKSTFPGRTTARCPNPPNAFYGNAPKIIGNGAHD